MRYLGLGLIGVLLSALSGVSLAVDLDKPASEREVQVQLLAPGYGMLDFEAPEAGSY